MQTWRSRAERIGRPSKNQRNRLEFGRDTGAERRELRRPLPFQACCVGGVADHTASTTCECAGDHEEENTHEACAAGSFDLRIDLYDGVVRDADSFGDSDAYCQFALGDEAAKFSGLFIDSNVPVFNEFFDFSCHRENTRISVVCYDYDTFDADDLIFEARVDAWPPAGVKTRWYDGDDEAFFFDVALHYGGHQHMHHGDHAMGDDEVDGADGARRRNRARRFVVALGVVIAAAAFLCGAVACRVTKGRARAAHDVDGVELEMAESVTVVETGGAPTVVVLENPPAKVDDVPPRAGPRGDLDDVPLDDAPPARASFA